MRGVEERRDHDRALKAASLLGVPYDVQKIRKDFPILSKEGGGSGLVYLDSAATAQKPKQVVEAISRFYLESYANIHRGVYRLSEEATEAYEGAREKIRAFIGAARREEVIFVRSTTEAINLVAQCFVRPKLSPGDEVVITAMEHHSNIVPWQIVCGEKGARLKVVPIRENGELSIEEYVKLLSSKTKFVSIVHLSNVLGTINPVREMIAQAHARGIPVLVDGAQAAPHLPLNMADLDADFYAFSGHKLYGPTGIGVLYGKELLLNAMPPYQGGGDMIRSVTFEKTLFNTLPYKFEAGTPHIAGAVGLGAAVDYLLSIGLSRIGKHESELLSDATQKLQEVEGLRIIGKAKQKASALSFVLEGVHPHDIGTILDRHGIAIRTGHHCAQPLMNFFGIPATARASFGLYNTKDEIDALMTGLREVKKLFG